MISSTSLQRTASQMIPTPGMSNLSANPEPLNKAGLLSGTTISPKLQQRKQYIGGHNSLQNAGGQMDNGLRSSLSQKSLSSGFPNSSTNGGLGSTGNNVHLMHNTMVSGGHLTASSYGFSSPSPRHSTSFDPLHQEHLMQSKSCVCARMQSCYGAHFLYLTEYDIFYMQPHFPCKWTLKQMMVMD